MIFVTANKIRVLLPTAELIGWCKKNLEIANPEYAKKKRMGLWVGNTPPSVVLWEKAGHEVHIPYGCLEELQELFPDGDSNLWIEEDKASDYMCVYKQVPLYSYQTKAVNEILRHKCGILQAPAGSGKTQMGLALIRVRGDRALWLTHTKDLLKQSRDRALQYWPENIMGTITEGKVDIGSHITFATIQTMSRLDLNQYKDYWDVVIVDECHRCAGSPTAVTQFSKVLNSLNAPYKYGLSATVHRADGLIRSTYAMLGQIAANVPKSAVEKTVMPVTIRPRETGVIISGECLTPDGMVNHVKLVTYLTKHEERNRIILTDIILELNDGHSCLVLSDRVSHLRELRDSLPDNMLQISAVIDGKMTSKAEKTMREQAIEDMRTGEKRILFATYALAKEGLDIPRLDRLFMATPQKDYAVITQSIGRIARTYNDKEKAVAYDYVDQIRSLIRAYRQRCTTYRKQGCEIEEAS